MPPNNPQTNLTAATLTLRLDYAVSNSAEQREWLASMGLDPDAISIDPQGIARAIEASAERFIEDGALQGPGGEQPQNYWLDVRTKMAESEGDDACQATLTVSAAYEADPSVDTAQFDAAIEQNLERFGRKMVEDGDVCGDESVFVSCHTIDVRAGGPDNDTPAPKSDRQRG